MHGPFTCQQCGGEYYTRDRRASKFCGQRCVGDSQKHEKPSKLAARARACRNVSLDKCSECGTSEEELHRHHPDIENQPDTVIVLCIKCHANEHKATGNWGGAKPSRMTKEQLEHLLTSDESSTALALRWGFSVSYLCMIRKRRFTPASVS